MTLIFTFAVFAVLGFIFARAPGAPNWVETTRLVFFVLAFVALVASGLWMFTCGLAGALGMLLGMLAGAVVLSRSPAGADCGCSDKKNKH